eukprot:TRINITY_DN3848_c0_g1_i2.p1 TRINITY_DN3848_c0_g1~~TRINITY_DN3848_c0_g1_i2.p1  ORF type:complete len:745 (+),score=158.27 TRINITY_DN3848_c0_g1_i2:30-2264(+)
MTSSSDGHDPEEDHWLLNDEHDDQDHHDEDSMEDDVESTNDLLTLMYTSGLSPFPGGSDTPMMRHTPQSPVSSFSNNYYPSTPPPTPNLSQHNIDMVTEPFFTGSSDAEEDLSPYGFEHHEDSDGDYPIEPPNADASSLLTHPQLLSSSLSSSSSSAHPSVRPRKRVRFNKSVRVRVVPRWYDARETSKSLQQGPKEPSFLSTLMDPHQRSFKNIMLLFICLQTAGYAFVYDIPAIIQNRLMDIFQIHELYYEAFYAVINWPSIVVPLFGGFLVDRFGPRRLCLVSSLLVLSGHAVFSTGVWMRQYYLALAGRVLCGAGQSSLLVCQRTFMGKWFMGVELAMAFGVAMSLDKAANSISFNVMPVLIKLSDVETAVSMGCAACMLSFACSILASTLDTYGEQSLRFTPDGGARMGTSSSIVEEVRLKELRRSRKFRLSHARQLDERVWVIYLQGATLVASVMTFVTMGNRYIQHKYQMDPVQANAALSVPYIVVAVTAPLLGWLIDRVGRNLVWAFGASMLMLAGQITITTSTTPTLGLATMGLAYSLVVAGLYPCIAHIVPSYLLGTAYGLNNSFNNLFISVTPLVVGQLLITVSDVSIAVYPLIIMSFLSLCLGFVLIGLDSNKGRRLNVSAHQLRLDMEQEALVKLPDVPPDQPRDEGGSPIMSAPISTIRGEEKITELTGSVDETSSLLWRPSRPAPANPFTIQDYEEVTEPIPVLLAVSPVLSPRRASIHHYGIDRKAHV